MSEELKQAAEKEGPDPEEILDGFQEVLFQATPQAMVTPAFIVLNLIIFLGMILLGTGFWDPAAEDLVNWGANYGPRTLGGEWWRLISNTFIHIGIIHLLFNMYVFFGVGFLVERLLGNLGFMFLYLISGVGGSLASLIWNPLAVSAGASGAIFGLFGALLGLLIRNNLALPPGIRKRIARDALIFLGYNLIAGLSQTHIDMAAHVGGLVMGFFCALLLSHPLTEAGIKTRPGRSAWVALIGAGILIVVFLGLPKDVARFDQEMDRFLEMEKTLIATFNQALGQARQDKMTDAQVKEIIEKGILPEWRAGRASLASLKHLPPRLEKRARTVLTYMKLREESWLLLVEAIQKKDRTLVQKSNAKKDEAEKVGRRIGSP